MKKGFIEYAMNDFTLFVFCGFIIFSPLFLIMTIKEFNVVMPLSIIISYYGVIKSYIKFNSEEWQKKTEMNNWINSLGESEIEELKKIKELKKNG